MVLVMTVPLVPVPQTDLAPLARRIDLDVTADGPDQAAGRPAADVRSGQRRERGRITERHS
jgi:hypothetical protein